MKYNKWTVALAAVGVVSLASAAKAEEKASPVVTALSSTTISGYVDTSAEWNIGTGDKNLPPYKFNGPNKADGFNLDVVQLRIDKPLDEQDWAAGYRADFWFGPDANILGTQSVFGRQTTQASTSDFGIRQAYVALRAPLGTGLDFKIGAFDSIIGYESIEAGNNPNFTRSYGHSIEPQTETGLLTSYRFCDCFSISAGIADTVGPMINDRGFAPVNATNNIAAESYKTYMGSVALTAPDSWGFMSGSTFYAGIVNGYADAQGENKLVNADSVTSYYVGLTLATPVTGLRAGMSFDYLDIYKAGNEDYSFAGYLSYQATEKLSFHARAEYFKDKLANGGIKDAYGGNGHDEFLFADIEGYRAEVLALTATVQYDLWKNVISRLEVRWDHSLLDNDIFGYSNVTKYANQANEVMVAANIIYKF